MAQGQMNNEQVIGEVNQSELKCKGNSHCQEDCADQTAECPVRLRLPSFPRCDAC
jgi:hypothetical protein